MVKGCHSCSSLLIHDELCSSTITPTKVHLQAASTGSGSLFASTRYSFNSITEYFININVIYNLLYTIYKCVFFDVYIMK